MRIKRRKTRQVSIGNVKIGGDAPVSIQSMIKTESKDVKGVIKEIKALHRSGCEIVRIAVKGRNDIPALGRIKRSANMPLVADIHFNYKLGIGAIDKGVDAVRLNPGNIYKKEDVMCIIKSAAEKKIPIRIGVNSGSLRIRRKTLSEDDAMVESARGYIKYFEDAGFRDIIISLKSSDVFSTISAYRKMAKLCDYPFHLGVTATGIKQDGAIKSAVGIGALLSEGIGDTIRVSLTSHSVSEVEAGRMILQSLGLRSFGHEVISCPTCGRCRVDIEGIVREMQKKLSATSHQPSVNGIFKIAIMGCEVNGPGEARDADIGIAAGKGSGALFRKGRIIKRVKEKDFVKEVIKIFSAINLKCKT